MGDESEKLQKNPDEIVETTTNAPELRARLSIQSRLSKSKVCGFVLVAAALAAVLMLYIPESFEEYLIDHMSLVQATLLAAMLALLVATVICSIIVVLWIKLPFSKTALSGYAHIFVKILPVSIIGLFRKKSTKLVFIIVMVAAVFYFTLPRTHLWNLARLWWSGPYVNLVSASPEESFQSTINLPWFTYGQDFGVVPSWKWQGVSQNRSTLEATFAQLRQSGVKCVLWFLLSDGRGAPSFDSKGHVTGLNQSFWQDYDTAIEVARKYQVGIVWVLLDFHWLAPARQENGATLFGHADVIKDGTKREAFFQQVLIPILRRHPLEPQIAGWLLINEPENGLKDANISFDQLAEFTHRASALIKKYTYRQPVSIGSADLESLMEYWGKDSSGLDFLVFHHYEKFLPPPADYVRSLMAGANDKPIYIGEFNIDDPPVPTNDLVNWSEGLGYAGLWSWKLNEDTGPPHYDEARQISDLIATTISADDSFRDQFRQRHLHPMDSLSGQFGQRIDWWRQHGAETVLPRVSNNIGQWEGKLSELKTQIETLKQERLRKEKELKEVVVGCFRQNQAGLKSSKEAVDRLNVQIDDYNNQIRQARENEDRAWEDKVLKWLQDTERNLEKERGNVKYYESAIEDCKKWQDAVESRIQAIDAEMNSKDALSNWYRYKIQWSRNLYQEFWKAELQK